MMAEGRRVLSAIPGVLEVFTGEAVQEDASYRYTYRQLPGASGAC